MTRDESRERGAVLVTGTSTGIGAATAIHLAAEGFRVFPGVRSRADGVALQNRTSDDLTPVISDITDESTISAAVDVVASAVGERGLAGLVNNAGIVKPGPIEFQPLADFRQQLEANLVSHVAVNVGSIGGRLVLPIYSASKFGMEALTDALRLELRQWRIPVCLVDPGATDTAIFGKTLAGIDGLEAKLGEHGYGLYAEQISAIRKLVEKTAADAEPATVLAKPIAGALMSEKPKTGQSRTRSGYQSLARCAKPAAPSERDQRPIPQPGRCPVRAGSDKRLDLLPRKQVRVQPSRVRRDRQEVPPSHALDRNRDHTTSDHGADAEP